MVAHMEDVAAFRAGDEAAFEKLVRLYIARCLAVATRILRDADEAKDAVQDAFLSAWKNRERFDGRSRFGTWLHRITVNASLQRLRKRRPAAEAELDPLLPSFQAGGMHTRHYATWREPSGLGADRAEIHAYVREAIQSLPETYRVVLVLRDVEGLDTAETATLLDVTSGVVKVRLHRARQALRTILDPHLQESSS